MSQTEPAVANRVGGLTLPESEIPTTEVQKLGLDDLKKACTRQKHQIIIMHMPADDARKELSKFLTKDMIVVDAEQILGMMFPAESGISYAPDAADYLSYRLSMGLMIDAIYNYREVRQVVVVYNPEKTAKVRQGMQLEATPQLEAWLDASRRSGMVPEKIGIVSNDTLIPNAFVDHFFGRSAVYHI